MAAHPSRCGVRRGQSASVATGVSPDCTRPRPHPSRSPRSVAWPARIALALAAASCTPALDLDGYSFPNAGSAGAGAGPGGSSGRAGTGGSAGQGGAGGSSGDEGTGGSAGRSGAGGSSGLAGTGGSSNAGTSGVGGQGGSTAIVGDAGPPSGADAAAPDGGSDAGGSGGSGGGDASAPECATTERCVPDVPAGFSGPIMLGVGTPGTCPTEFGTVLDVIHDGLQPGAATCDCGCSVSSVVCRLQSENTGDFFNPTTACESPPTADDCLTARSDASCNPIPFEDIRASTWSSTAQTCGGGTATANCGGGRCMPVDESFGSVCVEAAGTQACPAEFPVRSVYFADFADDRSCSTCGCVPEDQACQITIEVCSVAFFTTTLDEGQQQCLNSSDGDGVNIQLATVVENGSCAPFGGALQGTVTERDPRTVCCLE